MIGIATKFAPTADAFETAQRAGFRRAELWTDAAVLARHKEVARLARSYPFDYAVHFPNRLDQSPETLEATVHLCRALDVRALILHQPHQDRHGRRLQELWPEVPLAVENHRLDADGLTRWGTQNPGLTLDIEHIWMLSYPGESLSRILDEVRSLLERFAPKLRHVHLPGYWPGTGEHRPMYCSRDLVRGVWQLLEEVGFTGQIVSEVDAKYQNHHDLSMDVLLFERWRLERGESAP